MAHVLTKNIGFLRIIIHECKISASLSSNVVFDFSYTWEEFLRQSDYLDGYLIHINSQTGEQMIRLLAHLLLAFAHLLLFLLVVFVWHHAAFWHGVRYLHCHSEMSTNVISKYLFFICLGFLPSSHSPFLYISQRLYCQKFFQHTNTQRSMNARSFLWHIFYTSS